MGDHRSFVTGRTAADRRRPRLLRPGSRGRGSGPGSGRIADMIAATAPGTKRLHFAHGKDPETGLGSKAAYDEFEAIMDSLVACVQKAHEELLDLTCLANWTAVDGYTQNCLKLLN